MTGALILPSSSTGDVGGPADWLDVVTQYDADPTGSTDSTTQIQNALTAANPGQTVYLPRGVYVTSAPLTVPPFVVLRGSRGGLTAFDVQNQNGSVIQPSAGWTTSLAVKGIITLLDGQAGGYASYSGAPGANPGVQLRDMILDGSKAPASVDGIAAYGGVYGVRLDGIGMNLITGTGISCISNPSGTATPNQADGWHYTHVMILTATGGGVGNTITNSLGLFNDAYVEDVHVETCGGDGFYILNPNAYLVACRSDENTGNGYTINAFSATTSFQTVTLVGCGTSGNNKHGVNIINSSTTGQTSRAPVMISGCNFLSDGLNIGSGGGGYAGISVTGTNIVTVVNSHVYISTATVAGGAPEYGLTTATTGSGPGFPTLITVSGGVLNGATAPVNDGAPVGDALVIVPTTQLVTGTNGAAVAPTRWAGTSNQAAPTAQVIAETMPRTAVSATGLSGFTSGDVQMMAIGLPSGVTTIGAAAFTAGTAKTGGTHGWYVLCDHARKVLAVTGDQTDASTVWGSTDTGYPLAWGTPYTTTYSGLYYVGIMVAESAGTMPTFTGSVTLRAGTTAGTGLSGPLILAGQSSTGQTTTPNLGSTLTAITPDATRVFYALVY